MKNLLYIFLGGGLGSVLRFVTSSATQRWWTLSYFPLGTLLVNITGCFLIGLLGVSLVKTDESVRLLLITGFCGGFTTFSAFSSENLGLWQNGQIPTLILYILLSVLLSLAAVYAGIVAGRHYF